MRNPVFSQFEFDAVMCVLRHPRTGARYVEVCLSSGFSPDGLPLTTHLCVRVAGKDDGPQSTLVTSDHDKAKASLKSYQRRGYECGATRIQWLPNAAGPAEAMRIVRGALGDRWSFVRRDVARALRPFFDADVPEIRNFRRNSRIDNALASMAPMF